MVLVALKTRVGETQCATYVSGAPETPDKCSKNRTLNQTLKERCASKFNEFDRMVPIHVEMRMNSKKSNIGNQATHFYDFEFQIFEKSACKSASIAKCSKNGTLSNTVRAVHNTA
jgi:hypothetical protein